MIEDNVEFLSSDFEQIKKRKDGGKEYWSSRDLCAVLGYSTYQKFTRIINKAIAIANNKGFNVSEHFNQTVEMVKVGSGSFRKVENIHLSRIACLIIAENADGKKPQVQMAREYFKQEISTPESINNSLSANILGNYIPLCTKMLRHIVTQYIYSPYLIVSYNSLGAKIVVK